MPKSRSCAGKEAHDPNHDRDRGNRRANDRILLKFVLNQEPPVIQTPFGPVVSQAPTGQPHTTVTQDSLDADVISRVLPDYPPLAQQARIQGVVVLEAVINPQGTVENIKIVTGHRLLIQATIEAVKQWIYRPQPSEVTARILINFTF